MKLIKDLGMQYPTETSKRKRRHGLYLCCCGKTSIVLVRSVETGHTKSCGCKKGNFTHMLTRHSLFKTWSGMMDRCYNNKNPRYYNYGDRGISVCKRWHDIENFIEDMNDMYLKGLTLDRIDNNGNYEPSNCRWATKEIQARNTRKIRINNKSGYRGVCFYKARNKFTAQITVNSKKIHLGYFFKSLDAAKEYEKYIIDNNLEHTLNGVL